MADVGARMRPAMRMNTAAIADNPSPSRSPPGTTGHATCAAAAARYIMKTRGLSSGACRNSSGSILLCRRAIEPRHGYWTVPAGFMELGETLGEAAIRETWEEAQARVELGPLFAVVDVVHARQVHVFFRGTTAGAGFRRRRGNARVAPGPAGRRFRGSEIAFPSVTIALEQYLWIRSRATGRCTSPPPRGFVHLKSSGMARGAANRRSRPA